MLFYVVFSLSLQSFIVASLILAAQNRFRCHLQALRHLYVLAVEPRLLVPTDVDTKEACYCPVEISLRVNNLLLRISPCTIA